MAEHPKVWPPDPDYSDKIIWDAGVEFAHRQNDLKDTIIQHLQWLQEAYELPEDDEITSRKKAERINSQLKDLALLDENERILGHTIGLLIGRDGMVTQSPYQNHSNHGQDLQKPGYYFLDGEVVPLEP